MNYISHYGIKGQKWGVRRFQNRDGSRTPAGKKRYDNDPDYENVRDRKPVSSMSDAELKRRLNRLNMEKQYNTIQPETVKKGRSAVKKTLAAMAGITLAYATVTAFSRTISSMSKDSVKAYKRYKAVKEAFESLNNISKIRTMAG